MLRLKGPFFAIGMFGLARVLEAFALGFDAITGGTGIYLKPLGDLQPIHVATSSHRRHDHDAPDLAARQFTARPQITGDPRGRIRRGVVGHSDDASQDRHLRRLRRRTGGDGIASTRSISASSPADRPRLQYRTHYHCDGAAGWHGHRARPARRAILCCPIVNEVLWANYPQIYLASVGVIVLLAVLFMPRGIVNSA